MTAGPGPASLQGHRRQSAKAHRPSLNRDFDEPILRDFDNTTEEAKRAPDLILTWPARSLHRRRIFQEVFYTLYEQILHGCSSPTCHTLTCATYRRRTSKGPYRPYTVLSARALAAHLASEDHPSRKICPFIKAKRALIDDLEIKSTHLRVQEPSRTNSYTKSKQTKEALASPQIILSGGILPLPSRTKASFKGGSKQNEENLARVDNDPPAVKQEELSDAAGPDGNGQNVESDSKLESKTAERKKRPAPKGKDQKSLVQNIFDTAATTLLQLTKLPHLWSAPIASDATTEDGDYNSRPCANALNSTRGTMEKIIVRHISAKTLYSSKSQIVCIPDCKRQDGGLESINDKANTQKIHQRQCNNREEDEKGSYLTPGDCRILQSACEFCEYQNLNDEPVIFCLPKGLIDNHCVRLKSGIMLQLTARSNTVVFEPCGKPSKVAVSLCRDWIAQDTGKHKVLMVRKLGRTDYPMPIYQCNKRHRESPHTSLAKSTRLQCDMLRSSDYLLRFFVSKSIVKKTIVVWSIDFAKMVENFGFLHTFEIYPESVISNLWQSARSLYVEQPSRPPLPSLTGQSFDVGASESQVTLNLPEAAHIVKIVLAALVGSIKIPNREAWLAVQRLRRSGHIVLPRPGYKPPVSYALMSHTLAIMDAFEDDMAHSLVKRLAMALACRRNFENLSHHSSMSDELLPRDCGSEMFDLIVRALVEVDVLTVIPIDTNLQPTLRGGTLQGNFKGLCLQDQSKTDNNKSLRLEIVVEWLRGLLLKEWDGNVEVSKGSALAGALELLSSLYNHYGERYLSPKVFETSFVAERLDVVNTPLAWISSKDDSSKIHLLRYPFLFHPSILVSYFRAINHATMTKAFQESMSNSTVALRLTFTASDTGDRGRLRLGERLSRLTDSYLVLEIRRQDVLTDALNQLWRRQKRELVRPLKVRLGEEEGEIGIDHGGVQQEFFRVAIAEALDPKYGAFTTDPVTRMSWFQPGSLEPLYKFELLGILTSLAIYNGLTLPFTFPIALYMKILDHQPDHLEDISDGWPELSKGLRALGEWADGDVQDIFCRTYVFSVDVFGTTKDFNMSHSASSASASRPSTPEVPMVTNANRRQYISDYIRYLTHESIDAQYEAFSKGFKTVIDPKSLSLFTPNALQALVQGMPHINTHDLEAVTRYEGGFDRRHQVIRDFWSIVHAWSSAPPGIGKGDGPTKVRQLLEFVTASDRLPVGGESRVTFVVQKNGVGDERLPTSLTCFGRLLLPEYSGRKIMEEMLSKAVENAKGFGQP